MRRFRLAFFLSLPFLTAFSFSSLVFAEIVQLKNGNAIETKILKETDEFVIVEASGGKVKIPKSNIQTIWRGSKDDLLAVRGKEIYFAKGVELYKEGKFKESAESFEQALGPAAVNRVIYANLGSAYASAGEMQKAENNFLGALADNPGNPQVLLNAAHFFETTKQFSQAVTYYKKSLSLSPQDLDLRRGLAYCYFNLGEYGKALELYEALGRENDVVSSLDAALCCVAMGDLNKAEVLTEALMEAFAPPPRVYLVRAEIYRKKKLFPEAELEYKKFFQLKRDDPGALTSLGFLYLEMNENAQAEEQFQKVLSVDPGNGAAAYGIAQACIAEKAFEKAELYYKQALEAHPGNLSLLDNWGLLYLKQNQPQKALEIYQQLLARDEEYAKGHANKGLAYALMNDADNALKEWDRALELDPKLASALQNKKLLQETLQGEARAEKN